jgi:hypothetical protein
MAAGCNNGVVVISSKNHSETRFTGAANIVFAFSAVGFVSAVKTFISSKSFQLYLVSSTVTEYVVTPGAVINFVISFISFNVIVSSFATYVIVAFLPKDNVVIIRVPSIVSDLDVPNRTSARAVVIAKGAVPITANNTNSNNGATVFCRILAPFTFFSPL